MFFREPSVSGEPLGGGSRRATTSMVMFSWYQDRIVRETYMLFLETQHRLLTALQYLNQYEAS